MTGTPAAMALAATITRTPQARTYLMCPPEYFSVQYAINPWMTTGEPVDAALAMRQWHGLRETFRSLGHTVHAIEPVPGLPDMVFGGMVLGARFRHPERAGEAAAYRHWFLRTDYQVAREPRIVNEGEGDIVFTGREILAGYGFRTEPSAAADLVALCGLPVLSLRLVDPRFYHLDAALCVLDSDTAMYYPAAFDDAGKAVLASRFAELIEAKDEDAEVLGLNAISDGQHVVLPAQARGLAAQIAARGFEPIPVDMSEFRKAGGGPKCCTLELRP